jgi:hypothetical protein
VTFRVLVAGTLLFALAGGMRLAAQGAAAEVQTASGVHTVIFRTAAGIVRVQVAADAAPGDMLTGVVLPEPAGNSPEERTRNLAELNGMVLATAAEQTPVMRGRYEWLVPMAMRTGRVAVALRGRQGQTVAQTTVPIDGVPAPSIPATAAFELPAQAQAGVPAIIRGAFTSGAGQVAVRVGAVTTQVLAASPRRLAFAVPGDEVGRIPISVTAGGRTAEGVIRVVSVRLSATSPQLTKGQTATLTAAVSGLQGIDVPTTLVLTNFSTDTVRVQDGDSQRFTIAPQDVSPAGTFTLTRTLTGVRAGGFRITVLANRPPLTVFDATRAAEAVLASWEAATGIRITPATRVVIERSVMESSDLLQQFLAQQQQNRGDVRDIFAALLSHYCFDLRDGQQLTPRVASTERPSPFTLVLFAQARGAQREITAGDVERLSFTNFLNGLLARFSGAQPVGYLLISSVPASGGITIDGQRKSEMTNRRFVTSTGEHAIVIAAPSRTCRQRVQVEAYQTAVVTCGG